MSRNLLLTSVLIGLLSANSQSHAFEIDGTLVIISARAYSYVWSESSLFDIFVHRLDVNSKITEEGSEVDSKDNSCNKPTDEDGFPLDLRCEVTATDNSVTVGCDYCGTGKSTAYFFNIVTEQWSQWQDPKYWSDCREYQPGGGPGGGGL